MSDKSGKLIAIRDISLLLDYLDKSPDNRLLAQFDDTRANLTSAAPMLAKPPCHNYSDFLCRLTVIEKRANEKAVEGQERPRQSNGDHSLRERV
jgi:hypothetical protein